MKKIILICGVIIFFTIGELFPQNKYDSHLASESCIAIEPLMSHNLDVIKVLYQNLRESPVLYMLTKPSFEPEWMAGAFTIDSKYYLFSAEAEFNIWYYKMGTRITRPDNLKSINKDTNTTKTADTKEQSIKEGVTPSISDIKSYYKEVEISKELYLLIKNTWKAILINAKPTSGILGADGVMYHFRLLEKTNVTMGGVTWSPRKNSNNGLSVKLGYLLYDYAIGGNKQAAIEKEIRILCKDLLKRCR